MKEPESHGKQYLLASDFDQTLSFNEEWDRVRTDFRTIRETGSAEASA